MSENLNYYINHDDKFHLHTYKRLPVCFARGEGVYLWDTEDRRYVDFISGLGVVNLGHVRPEVTDALCRQAGKLIHVSNLFYTRPQAVLAEQLVNLAMPGGKCFFANSGAEANEGAIKLARRWGKRNFGAGKHEIITALRSFHGRTMKTLAATGQPEKQKPFEPLPGGFRHVPYNDLAALENVIGEDTCAVLLEVVQGEGGVYVADQEYLKGVRRLCDERDVLLIFDEVQSGLGRTGKMFAWEHFGARPDIMTLAKALANGLPIGALVTSDKAADAFDYGDHGSTFGGGPPVCAAASAVLNVMVTEDIPRQATTAGDFLRQGLIGLATRSPGLIKEVRGLGLMLGMELSRPIGRDVVLDMLSRGYIINNIGDQVLRFLPPLIISEEQTIGMLQNLELSLGAAAKGDSQ